MLHLHGSWSEPTETPKINDRFREKAVKIYLYIYILEKFTKSSRGLECNMLLEYTRNLWKITLKQESKMTLTFLLVENLGFKWIV